MLRRGEWRAEDKSYKGKTAGFHLSSLYSPVGWFSWGQMAAMFLEAKQNVELLKVFVNTCLGETWVDRGDAPEWEKLFMRREPYERGKIPEKGLILLSYAALARRINPFSGIFPRSYGSRRMNSFSHSGASPLSTHVSPRQVLTKTLSNSTFCFASRNMAAI